MHLCGFWENTNFSVWILFWTLYFAPISSLCSRTAQREMIRCDTGHTSKFLLADSRVGLQCLSWSTSKKRSPLDYSRASQSSKCVSLYSVRIIIGIKFRYLMRHSIKLGTFGQTLLGDDHLGNIRETRKSKFDNLGTIMDKVSDLQEVTGSLN